MLQRKTKGVLVVLLIFVLTITMAPVSDLSAFADQAGDAAASDQTNQAKETSVNNDGTKPSTQMGNSSKGAQVLVDEEEVPPDKTTLLKTYKGFQYTVNGKTVQILGYKGKKTKLNIPGKIKKKTVTSVAIESGKIKALNLKACKGLKTLYLDIKKVKKLDLSKNLKLQVISVKQSSIKSLNIKKHRKLISLTITNSKLNSINLTKNLQLTDVNVMGNKLTKLNVTKNTKLQKLICSYNKIKKLNISKNINLEIIGFEFNPNLVISSTEQNQKLEFLTYSPEKTKVEVMIDPATVDQKMYCNGSGTGKDVTEVPSLEAKPVSAKAISISSVSSDFVNRAKTEYDKNVWGKGVWAGPEGNRYLHHITSASAAYKQAAYTKTSAGKYDGQWCARFINWCVKAEGLSTAYLPTGGIEGVIGYQEWAIKNSKYHHVANGHKGIKNKLPPGVTKRDLSYMPKPGDIAIIDRRGTGLGNRDHVTIVRAAPGTPTNGTIYTYGGNEGYWQGYSAGAIRKDSYKKSIHSDYITGYVSFAPKGTPPTTYYKTDFKLAGGTSGGMTGTISKTTISGKNVPFPAKPTRAGYLFTGWYTAASGGTQVTSLTANANRTIYAQWKPGYAANTKVGDRFVAGDFNGDGKQDVATMYDYGNGSMKIHVFLSDGSKFNICTTWYTSTQYWANAGVAGRLVAGDFNGDGKDDLAAMYGYANGETRIHVFLSTGTKFNGVVYPDGWYRWDKGKYPVNGVANRIMAGDFNGDGKDDIAAMYDYGKGTTKIHVFMSDGSKFKAGAIWYTSTQYWANAGVAGRLVAGDFNGDGKDDLAAMYGYANGETRIHAFLSTGIKFNSIVYPDGWYKWEKGKYPVSGVANRLVAGDFNGDGKDDVATMYDYGGGNMKTHVFVSAGNKFKPGATWFTGTQYWANAGVAGRFTAGDFNRDGKDDLSAVYAYANGETRIHAFLSTGAQFNGIIYPTGWQLITDFPLN